MASWGSLDGTNSAQGSGVSSLNCTITTTTAGDLIIVLVSLENSTSGTQITVSGVTDNGSAGVTFTKRSQKNLSTGSPTCGQDCEMWWGVASGTLSSESIEVSLSGTCDAVCVGIVAVPGANTTTPWDGNSSLPAVTECTSGTDTTTEADCTISTSAANTMIIAMIGGPGDISSPLQYPSTSVPSGLTQYCKQQDPYAVWAETIVVEVNWYSSAQNGISFGWTYTNTTSPNDSAFLVLVDAIVQAGGASFTPKSRRTFGPRIGDRQAIGW